MQARLSLSKEECFTLLKNWYMDIHQIPVEVTPVFPLLSNGDQPTVFFRMNESMLNEQGFLSVLNSMLEQSGFYIAQSMVHVNMENEIEFQGISIVINQFAETNLDVLPEWLSERIANLKFADCILVIKTRKYIKDK